MTRDETIALFQRCEQARADALAAGKEEDEAHEAAKAIWNAWAEGMLAERKALEEAGEWAAGELLGELLALNDKTQDWIARASVNFSNLKFYNEQEAFSFSSVLRCKIDRIVSQGPSAILDRYFWRSFWGEIRILLLLKNHKKKYDREYPKNFPYERTRIINQKLFNVAEFVFPGNARFEGSYFGCDADFTGTKINDKFEIDRCFFSQRAIFDNIRFSWPLTIHHCHFADISFTATYFEKNMFFFDTFFFSQIDFEEDNFAENIGFIDCRFFSRFDFSGRSCPKEVTFDGSRFYRRARFNRVYFSGEARFTETCFRDVIFNGSVFSGQVSFYRANFRGAARFNLVEFQKWVSFRKSIFHKYVGFVSMRSNVGFDMSEVRFMVVPDFSQSTLHRGLRLDNVQVRRGSLIGPVWESLLQFDQDAPTKFRELRRFAKENEDLRSELHFHGHEIRSARFVNDWPSQPRFWFGIGYELFSNFGRSIIRPAIAWGVLVTVFAAIYLGISADLNGRAPDYASLAPYGGTQSCLSIAPVADDRVRAAQAHIAATTSASAEAWSLALKNGFVFIDWDRAEAARRTYGCLFGLTSDGGNTYPVVPRAVSVAGLIQNVLSAVLIFLLLLGVRNLLKLK